MSAVERKTCALLSEIFLTVFACWRLLKSALRFSTRIFPAAAVFYPVFHNQQRPASTTTKYIRFLSIQLKKARSARGGQTMKFTCEKHILQAAVNAASRAASARSSIPALEGLLIQAGSGVRVTGYDLRKGIYQNIEAEVEQSGEAVVMTAKLLGEMMRVLPDGMVTVEVGENGKTSIKCGMSEYSFMSLPASDYPELPESDYANAITLEQQKLSEIIDETIFAVLREREQARVYGQPVRAGGRQADRRLRGRLPPCAQARGGLRQRRKRALHRPGQRAAGRLPPLRQERGPGDDRPCREARLLLHGRHRGDLPAAGGRLPQLPQDHTRELPLPPGRAARGYALRHRPRQPGGGRDGQKPHTPDLRRRRDRLRMQHLPSARPATSACAPATAAGPR